MNRLYTAKHRKYDHVGNLTPNVEVSEGIRSANEFKPANWLPVRRFDKFNEDYFVISVGQIVALDCRDGDVVPAGLRRAFADAAGGATTIFSYSERDVEELTEDVRTGAALLSTATLAVTRDELETALLGTTAGDNPLSEPIGIAPYNYYKWAGGDGSNPSGQKFHNYKLQHQVAVLHDYHIEVPLVPDQAANESLTTEAQWSNTSGDVYCRTFSNVPIASPTQLKPYVFSNSTLFSRPRTSESELTQNGDYFVNTATGQLCLFHDTVDPTSDASTLGDVTYFHYASAPASVSTFASATGDLKPGSFVTYDANSNYTAWATGDPAEEIVGQVLALPQHPKDLLDRVRTAYPDLPSQFPWPGGAGDFDKAGDRDKNPGSSTGGMPSAISFAGGADLMVRINLIMR